MEYEINVRIKMTEQEYVVKSFCEAFEKRAEEKIVLYGLGKNTEAIINKKPDVTIVGLMDSQNEGKNYWGYPVLSCDQVRQINPIIVIIARESVVPIIYERIAYLYKDYGICIYNFRGELLGRSGWKYINSDLPYWNLTEGDLLKAVDQHECVSFDLFDTLIMRKVLEPTDVFALVQENLEKKGYINNNFRKRRLEAERKLKYPNIREIYKQMSKDYLVPEEVLDIWMDTEIKIERECLVPRKKMVEIFNYAVEHGKKVWILSDMYYPKEILHELLNDMNIKGYQDIMVSCDYGADKENGDLYELYQKKEGENSFLHVGDNRYSDGEKAKEHGIDSFLIYSAYDMWMASSMQRTVAQVKTLKQKCILGLLVWKLCENPFAFHESKGHVNITESNKLGYVFLGGLFYEFLQWLKRELIHENIEELLLPARDGYLIWKMLQQEKSIPFKYIYFKASRRAVSVAAIETRDDLKLLLDGTFQGNIVQLLKQRFGIECGFQTKCEERVSDITLEKLESVLSEHEEEILYNAAQEREEYLRYLKQIGICGKKKQAIFDFIAKGTVQFYLQKLLGHSLQGLYFATMNHPHKPYELEKKIKSYFGNINSYGTTSNVARHYLFLESIMVDGNPTFEKVEKGKFVYAVIQENKRRHEILKDIQWGILQFQTDMSKLCCIGKLDSQEQQFTDQIFGCLFDGSSALSEKMGKAFLNDDNYNGISNYQVWNGL